MRQFISVIFLAAIVPGAAYAEPCVSCRTEKCPTQPGIAQWCGTGADPLAKVAAPAAREKYEAGVHFYDSGDYEKALEAFKAAYELSPDAVFLFNISQCQRMIKSSPAKAAPTARGKGKATRDKVAPAAREKYEAGVRFYDSGDYEKALDAFKAAHKLSPDDVFQFNIGQCQRMIKNPLAKAELAVLGAGAATQDKAAPAVLGTVVAPQDKVAPAAPSGAGAAAQDKAAPATLSAAKVAPAARGEGAATHEKAREKYEVGVRFYNIGDYEKALDSFKAAYVLTPDAVFLFNIGQCQRMMRNPLEAIRAYRSFLREQPHAKNRVQVEEIINDLEAAMVVQQKQPAVLLPAGGESAKTAGGGATPAAHEVASPETPAATGAIIVESNPVDANVRIDDKAGAILGTTPFIQRSLAVGVHMVFLSKDGYENAAKTFNVDHGGVARLDITLTPKASVANAENMEQALRKHEADVAARAVAEKTGRGLRISGALLQAVGLVLVTGAILVGTWPLPKQVSNAAEFNTDPSKPWSSGYAGRVSDINNFHSMVLGFAIGGSLVFLGGLAMNIVSTVQRSRALERLGQRVSLTPTVGPSTGGLVLGGSF